MEYALSRTLDEILIYATMALLGEPSNVEYGFRLVTDPVVIRRRAAVELLAKGINSHPTYDFGPDRERVIKALDDEAARGTAGAILAIARMQDVGINVELDAVAAFDGYLKAAGLNNDSARQLAAVGYASGKGTDADATKALEMVEAMSSARRARGYLELARSLAEGPTSVQDFELASELALKAGSSDPLLGRQAVEILRKTSTSPDVMEQIERLIQAAAAAGDPKALAALTEEIDSADSSISAADAIRLYEGLASKGNARAAKILTVVITRPDNTDEERRALLEILLDGAQAGGLDAMKAAGRSYLYGIGVDPDFTTAAGYYRQAADLGDAEAQYFTGLFYLNAIGTPQDLSEARSWLERRPRRVNARLLFP